MALFLFGLALLSFWAGHPVAALAVRCALGAGGRFSPRAALALSCVASCSGALCALARRGGLRAVSGKRMGVTSRASFVGGVIGRAALLMFVARFPGSLDLARVQVVPLLLLAALSLVPRARRHSPLPRNRAGYALLCAAFSAVDGFFGAGGMTLFTLTTPDGVRRDELPTASLLAAFCAQAGALLLTLLCDAAQVFPVRMPLMLAAGAALGALAGETQKERGALHRGMRAALHVYLILAALSCVEQAL